MAKANSLERAMKGSFARYIAEDFVSSELVFNKRIPLVVTGVTEGNKAAVISALDKNYGDVAVIVEDGDGEEIAGTVGELCGLSFETVLVTPVAMQERKRFDFSDLVEIMKRLCAEDGCEWDKAQTHASIRINLIEEAYELVEAIDADNRDMMLEECGDVLMQAIFHTEIAEKEGDFDFTDMLTALCRKLIDRHTHIFGANHADNPDEALVFWNEAKKKEKKYKSNADAMDRVPKNLPSLLYAEKLQKIAKKCGFDWTDIKGAKDKIYEETEELLNADKDMRVEEGGDLLFAVVNTLRFLKVEPEIALREASAKFLRRFAAVENTVIESGREMTDCTLDELDSIWNDVKRSERDER